MAITIIGDRQTGKTAIAIDTILNQKAPSDLKFNFKFNHNDSYMYKYYDY